MIPSESLVHYGLYAIFGVCRMDDTSGQPPIYTRREFGDSGLECWMAQNTGLTQNRNLAYP